MAWIMWFIQNSRAWCNNEAMLSTKYLTTTKLRAAEEQWIKAIQAIDLPDEIATLQMEREIIRGKLLPFCPFLDPQGVMRIGGRQSLSQEVYDQRYPTIVSGRNAVTGLIIHGEHQTLLHGGLTLITASLPVSVLSANVWKSNHPLNYLVNL